MVFLLALLLPAWSQDAGVVDLSAGLVAYGYRLLTVTLEFSSPGIATLTDSLAYGSSKAAGSLRQLNPGGTLRLRLSTVLEGDRYGDGPKHEVFGDRALIRVRPRIRIYEVHASPSQETFVHLERCFPFQSPLAAAQSFELHCTHPPE